MSSTTTAGLTELELKRRAVLESFKKSRSRSQSPLVTYSTAVDAPTAPTNDDLYEAILDLRGLGYTFEQIVIQSGVKREFLLGCYRKWDFPVPPTPVTSKVHQIPTPPLHSKKTLGTPPQPQNLKARPTFQHKVYRREIESPSWLKNLVIDLESSDDDESVGDDSEDDEDDEDVEAERSKSDNDPSSMATNSSDPSPKADTDSSSNKRKLEVSTLDEIKSRKQHLKVKIDSLSKELTESDKLSKNMDREIERREKNIKSVEQKLKALLKQIEDLTNIKENGLQVINDLRAQRVKHHKLKDSLAELLIELEGVEKQELSLLEIETKKKVLREKLLSQMKNKKQKVQGEQKALPDSDQQDQNSDANCDSNDDEFVSTDTIHKIPKTQKSSFTPYQSFGFKNLETTAPVDDKSLCPIELLNGSCTEKGCKFQHLD